MEKHFVEFTKEMKDTHTIFLPSMLPIHLTLVEKVLNKEGFHCVLLTNEGPSAIEEGVSSVHNDTCYPALLVIGQFLDALKNGGYDPHKCALLITQTGGGCRASNYIHLLRKALKQNNMEYVPVISVNFSGLESHSGFQLSLSTLIKVLYAIIYGDFLMIINNQVRAREVHKGSTKKVFDECITMLCNALEDSSYRKTKKYYRQILEKFDTVEQKTEETIKVGIVGEIYMKYAPFGNQHLEDVLIEQGVEPVVSGVLDFGQYFLENAKIDQRLYGKQWLAKTVASIAQAYVTHQQENMAKAIEKHGRYRKPSSFKEVKKYGQDMINDGVKMGEGWLLTSEMCELIESGVNNIVCTQPFGCLPNHIVAKGMMRKIKEKYPLSNITAIDYDASASAVNQMNRIQLMLINARNQASLQKES